MFQFNYLKRSNSEYIEELFQLYLKDPNSVDESWRYFFDGLELSNGHSAEVIPIDLSNEAKVADLINAYRTLGFLMAHLNPLDANPPTHPLLEISHFQLTPADLNKTFTAGKLIGMGHAKLSEIIAKLRTFYCSTIGYDCDHIFDKEARSWIQSQIESEKDQQLDPETKKLILKRLTQSKAFENFLHTRYVAQKRFSIEGAEGLIPALDRIIEVGADLGSTHFVMGMAHRGRLNVLTHIFGKKPEYIFTEYEENFIANGNMGQGDVKYHKGFSAIVKTRSGKEVALSLANNPSHLEFVDPVVEGIAKAKQALENDETQTKVVPLLIHGEAAFAGQGVIYETLNLSGLKGYSTGGTIHIIIDNQVGFTTSPSAARSTTFSTDIAKMLEVPIFHVNGDDPEAIWKVARIAMEYRQKFKKDVFIDLICYRKYGHNEGDEPAFTQPLLYKKIESHLSPREVYAKKLIAEKTVTESEAQTLFTDFTDQLSKAQEITKTQKPHPFSSSFDGRWKGFKIASGGEIFDPVTTFVPDNKLKELSEKLNTMPKDFGMHSKLGRFFEARLKAIREGQGIDWGNAETLAYATLLDEGFSVRVSGQDVERGTFTHRHAVLHDQNTGKTFTPLQQLAKTKTAFTIQNSHLSETAVLGFEYGWSLVDPQALVIWEAQFGDFANGAQVIIDQFIAPCESKWQRSSGVVMFLPHGFEGQGAEHSSARLERFLQLAGMDNMFVCNLTTPAQIFHALRRHMKRFFRKPMIVMTPKSLLRHPQAISGIKDLSQGTFQEIIDDPLFKDLDMGASASKLILCSGKIYYELVAEREKLNQKDTAIVRIEQLYPLHFEKLAATINWYTKIKEVLWVQEEPKNMGAWPFIFSQWSEKVRTKPLIYIGRDSAAAPAVGFHKVHAKEQKNIIDKAMGVS